MFIMEFCTLHHSKEHFKMKPEMQTWFFTETKCYCKFMWYPIPAFKLQLPTQEICEAICFSSSHDSHDSKPRKQVKILHIQTVTSRWLLTHSDEAPCWRGSSPLLSVCLSTHCKELVTKVVKSWENLKPLICSVLEIAADLFKEEAMEVVCSLHLTFPEMFPNS